MRSKTLQLLVSDAKGRITNISGLGAAGMKGGLFFRLRQEELIRLPPASVLFMLPRRLPAGYNCETDRFIVLKDKYFAVAAFISPGFTITYNAAYREINGAVQLPLFSYAAVVFYNNGFYVPAIKIDKNIRHDPRFIDINLVRNGIRKFKKQFHKNRLIAHLKNCALINGCPNAQNFFLSRFEAPLPVSPSCNAHCAGCISYQPDNRCPATQPRIKFVPTPEEVAEIALFHIDNVRNAIVSFGQGCEGEPLLAGDVIEKAIRLIRKETSNGTININTNASKPEMLSGLFDAGLDSVRVSLNSVRKEYYMRYYKPRGYAFKDITRSIKIAKKKGAFVSINYLTVPGFTDLKDEFTALEKFIAAYSIDMVQWRNLNYDPLRYFDELKICVDVSQMLGIRQIIGRLRKKFPNLMMGYFNPALR